MSDKVTDWRNSPGHIYVLSRFLKLTDCHWADTEHYLKESKKKAIDRWLAEGIVEECDVETKVKTKYTVAELKELLKKHEEPVSGNKDVLMERALRVARGELEQWAVSVHLWQCTPDGVRIVEEHQAAEEAAKSEAMHKCLAALIEHDLKGACMAHHKYEERYERNVRYGSADYQWEGKRLERIFQCRPQAVGAVKNDEWRQLQTIAALKTLWRLDLDDDWLPEDIPALGEDRKRAINLVLANAEYRESIPDDEWIKSATIRFDDYDLSICDSCRSLNGKKFPVKELPEFPTPDCTNPEGCRCRLESDYEESEIGGAGAEFDDFEEDENPVLEPLEALKQLKGMLDVDLITTAEYEEKKKEILARM